MESVSFGPTGAEVYARTYSRMVDGVPETWRDTVARVVCGNFALVYGPPKDWSDAVRDEAAEIADMMLGFKVVPAGRHLWASGAEGAPGWGTPGNLFNCFVADWDREDVAAHFRFTFMRLMEGGGVGCNYSTYRSGFHRVRREVGVAFLLDESHPDYAGLAGSGVALAGPGGEGRVVAVDDTREGWAEALVEVVEASLVDALQLPAVSPVLVFDLNAVRQSGSPLVSTGGVASGPVPLAVMLDRVVGVFNARVGAVLTPVCLMEVDHAIAECVVAGGNRRSARMSIVHWRDPHIMEFLACKADGLAHWSTNISVEYDYDFVYALADGRDEAHGLATAVWDGVVRGMLTNGEPGLWNSSYASEDDPGVVATNPCGEISLEPWESCNLGHVNLASFVHDGVVDMEGLERAHVLMARFLYRATFSHMADERQREVVLRNRRIGVGHFGVQGFLALQGVRYSEATVDGRPWPFHSFLSGLRETVREAADCYADKLGTPRPIKVTAIAPTGTVAKLSGDTEGIHPVYGRYYVRRVRFSMLDDRQVETVEAAAGSGLLVEDCVYDRSGSTVVVSYPTRDVIVDRVEAVLPSLFPEGCGVTVEDVVEDASEVGLFDMLLMLEMYQMFYADNGVSFTANVQPGPCDCGEDGAPSSGWVEEVQETLLPFLLHVKGFTLMVDGSRPQAPYERVSREVYEASTGGTIGDALDGCVSGACPVK